MLSGADRDPNATIKRWLGRLSNEHPCFEQLIELRLRSFLAATVKRDEVCVTWKGFKPSSASHLVQGLATLTVLLSDENRVTEMLQCHEPGRLSDRVDAKVQSNLVQLSNMLWSCDRKA